jgi:AcrR family transcriptional regulator
MSEATARSRANQVDPGRVHRGNRYRRSEEGRQAILHAADDLLLEKGFDGVTVEGIARRAGVGKQTIYRWWRTKADVLLDAFLQDTLEDLEPADSGDLTADLIDYLRRLGRYLGETDQGVVFRTLMARAQLDSDFAGAFRARCLDPQRERSLAMMQRWIDHGMLPPDADLVDELEQLTSPYFHRVLVDGRPIEDDMADRLVHGFLIRHGHRDHGPGQ